MSDRVAVVGSGPNGLAAAVTLARAGLQVEVLERNDWVGGGAATREITLPGFKHDLASAVHPMALASPFFQAFELSRRIDLVVPEVSFGHPLPGGRSGHGYRDLDRAADAIGRDGKAYRTLLKPVVDRIDAIGEFTVDTLLRVPKHPIGTAIYGERALELGTPLWGMRFREEIAPAMLIGCAAHTIGRHPRLSMAGAGLMLSATAHAAGWPVPVGGSQAIADALVADLEAHGGRVRTGVEVTSLAELDDYDATLLDVSAPALLRLGGDRHRAKMAKIKAARDRMMATKTGEKGLVIVHTGPGKGKSSAAFGMIFRAIAHGMPSAVVQFIKGARATGERDLIERHFAGLCAFHTMGEGFTWETQDKARDIAAARAAWEVAKTLIRDPHNRMVLLDEINIALRYDYLDAAEVAGFLATEKPEMTHVVLTGRNAKPEILEVADLVTEMTLVKHPFRAGIKAQPGVEF